MKHAFKKFGRARNTSLVPKNKSQVRVHDLQKTAEFRSDGKAPRGQGTYGGVYSAYHVKRQIRPNLFFRP